MALAALPFARLAISAVRGLPADVRAHALAATTEHPGSFEVGFGLTPFGLLVRVVVTHVARGTRDARGATGILVAALEKHVHPFAPAGLVAVIVVVVVARLVRRAVAVRSSSRLVRSTIAAASSVTSFAVGRRTVALYVSPRVDGSPFTGGFFEPYIVFPEATWAALSPEERSAALAHEVAHVRDGHVLLAALAAVVADLFVFLPFVSRAERSFRDALEASADESAVARGTCPFELASALVRVREIASPRAVLPALALGAGHASLGARVDDLLEAPSTPRFEHVGAGTVAALVIALLVLRSLFLP